MSNASRQAAHRARGVVARKFVAGLPDALRRGIEIQAAGAFLWRHDAEVRKAHVASLEALWRAYDMTQR